MVKSVLLIVLLFIGTILQSTEGKKNKLMPQDCEVIKNLESSTIEINKHQYKNNVQKCWVLPPLADHKINIQLDPEFMIEYEESCDADWLAFSGKSSPASNLLCAEPGPDDLKLCGTNIQTASIVQDVGEGTTIQFCTNNQIAGLAGFKMNFWYERQQVQDQEPEIPPPPPPPPATPLKLGGPGFFTNVLNPRNRTHYLHACDVNMLNCGLPVANLLCDYYGFTEGAVAFKTQLVHLNIDQLAHMSGDQATMNCNEDPNACRTFEYILCDHLGEFDLIRELREVAESGGLPF